MDLPSLALAVALGFQSGAIASWHYHRRQFARTRELLVAEIKHERRERRRLEDQIRSLTSGRRGRTH